MGENNELATQHDTGLLQMAKMQDIKSWYKDFVKLSKEILKKDLDYGEVPGVSKPALFKPGAEKLRFVYRLQTETTMTDKTIDLSEGLIDFTYKTTVKTPDGSMVLSTCEGNANSYETKFRYVWVKEDQVPEGIDLSKLQTRSNTIQEFAFAIDKSETTGPYGKPAEYWQKWKDAISDGSAKKITKQARSGKSMDAYEMGSILYRVENPDVMGLKNTIMKMAQKRSFVGAVLIATGASEFFTQDVEDMEVPIDEVAEVVEAKKPTTKAKPAAKPATKPERNMVQEAEEVMGATPAQEVRPAQQAKPAQAEQPAGPADGGLDERMRQAKLKWVVALREQGKIPKADYESMSLADINKVMDEYKSKIGK